MSFFKKSKKIVMAAVIVLALKAVVGGIELKKEIDTILEQNGKVGLCVCLNAGLVEQAAYHTIH